MPEVEEVLATCSNILPGHGREKPIKASLLEIADSLSGDELADRYGQGEYIKSFESEMAEMFGKEAAVFLPSGTMAQQIALRVWCEQSHN